MTDVRTSFVTLEDSSSQAGLPLHKVAEGDAIAAKNYHGAMVAKSGSNFALLKLNPSTGALLVDGTGVIVAKMSSPSGELAAGSLALADVTNASIVLAVNKVYENIGIIVACRRDALWQIVWKNDVTDIILAQFITGPGQYNTAEVLGDTIFTTGATGTQTLRIVAKNFEVASSLRATVTVQEHQ